MSGEALRVAVAGATGALGSEIVRVLDQVSWRPGQLVALARHTTSVTHVDYGEDRVPVDVVGEDTVNGVDVLFVATPAEPGRALVEAAIQQGIITIDCSSSFTDDVNVPLVVPWVNPDVLASVASLAAIPDPSSILVASVLGPLRRAGIVGSSHALVMVPASQQGKAGIEELSRQVVALFNNSNPPRRVFPTGLAFDLLPAVGLLGEDGWSDQERLVAEQVRRVASLEEAPAITMVGVPVFSGIAAHVALALDQPMTAPEVLQVLSDGGVRVPESAAVRDLPRPRRVEGKPFVHVGRVRLGADGRALHLWLTMDNLRTAATAAVATAGALLQVQGTLQ